MSNVYTPALKGVHIDVSLPITRLGQPESFQDVEFLEIRFVNNRLSDQLVVYTADKIKLTDNIVSVVIPDTDSSRLQLGFYDVQFTYRKTNVLRPNQYEPFKLVVPAFSLVATTAELGVDTAADVEVQSVVINGELFIARDGLNGASAFQIWQMAVGTPESTVLDYLAWLRLPVDSAATEFEALTDQFNTFNASANASENTRNTKEAERNENESMRLVDEQLRKNAEAARVLAEQTRQQNESDRETLFDQSVSESAQATAAANTAAAAANAAANAQNTYNVTVAIPLAAGSYYNKTTSRAAVPAVSRKLGLVITYATADKVWYSEKYIGSTVAGWATEANWEQVPDAAKLSSLETDLNYVKFSSVENEYFINTLINKGIDSSGNIISALGRIAVNDFIPINHDPVISSKYNSEIKIVAKRFYDSAYIYTGTVYTQSAKYIRPIILISDGTGITDVDIRKNTLLYIDSIEYSLVEKYLKVATKNEIDSIQNELNNLDDDINVITSILPVKENYTKAYVNRNYNVNGLEIVNGRIAIDYMFTITSAPSASSFYNGVSKPVVFRYYDINKQWIGTAYSSSALYAHCVILFSDGTVIADDLVLNNITFTFNGTSYFFDIPYEKVAPLSIVNNYYGYLMQIFTKYTVIGDSLSAGFMSIDGITIPSSTARSLKNNWPGYLEKRIGQTITNLAVGSSNTHHWRYADGPSAPTNVADLNAANIPTDSYLIALGVNDMAGVVVGSHTDIATFAGDNADTFYGNYDYIVRKLHEYNQNSHIFLLTIPKDEPSPTLKEQYNNAIRHISTLYERVHLIDLFVTYPTEFLGGIILENHIGGHYNPIGYNYISVLIEKAINNYIYKNNSLFRTAPYYL